MKNWGIEVLWVRKVRVKVDPINFFPKKSFSCMASLLLGAVLVFSILSIHTVLLKERQRIENIEQQILTQQKQWSEIWVKSREEDKANVSFEE